MRVVSVDDLLNKGVGGGESQMEEDTNPHFILYTGSNLRNTRTGSALESSEDRNGPERRETRRLGTM